MPNAIIAQATITGNILRLPPVQLDRKEYLKVAAALELIGGKWKGGKTLGFVFPSDPTPLVEKLLTGDKIVSAKKEFQYFPTPDEEADRLVMLAAPLPGESILEPSAGQGAIVRAVHRWFSKHFPNEPQPEVSCFEAMPLNKEVLLQTVDNIIFEGADFLECDTRHKWNVIIANPPFTKNQDIDHIRKMYEHLAPGGRLVTLASPHWEFSTNQKETEFRIFLDDVCALVKPVPKGTFRESGTEIETRRIYIIKPL